MMPISKHIFRMGLIIGLVIGLMPLIPADRLHAASGSSLEIKTNSAAPLSVNINTAGAEELQKLRGIGPAIAARIIEYRQQSGPFKSSDDLAKVRGVGGAKLQKIKSQITV